MKSAILKEENRNIDFQIVLEKQDYESEFNQELKKTQKAAHMKGFRKGKTPLGLIKKMYGQGLLGDLVNKKLDEAVRDFLREHEIETVGYPLGGEDQEQLELDPSNLEDYTFKFFVGRSPELSLDEVLADTYPKYEVEVSEEEVNEQFERIRKRDGENVSYDTIEDETNLVSLNVKELDEDGEIKAKGLESSFDILVSSTNEEYKGELVNQKMGHSFDFNIWKLEKDAGEDMVRKHILKLDEEEMDREVGSMFRADIVDCQDVEPAEVNEEFLTKNFGEEVKDEAAAKEKIKNDIASFFNEQIEALFVRGFQKQVLEKMDLDFPEAYMERLIEESSNEPITNMAYSLDSFKKELSWSMLTRKLTEKFDIKVEAEDVKDEFRAKVKSYFGGAAAMGIGEDFIEQMVNRLMGDKEQVESAYQAAMFTKLIKRLLAEVNLDLTKASTEELNEKIAAVNQAEAAQEFSEEE